MENKKYDISLAIENQKELCKRKNYPHFAPLRGECWVCGRNIYEQIGWSKERKQVPLNSDELHRTTGITVEKAGRELITGCPHCNRSYCD